MKPLVVNLTLLLIIAGVTACDAGCFHCDEQTSVCLACLDGHQLTLLGACVPEVIPNCRLYLNAQQCLRCVPTYKVVNNFCQRDYSGCLQNITSSRCAKCSSELVLASGTCIGVLNCGTNSSTCPGCQQGFILSSNICLSSPQNCRIVDSNNGVCFQCNYGYHLVGYKCLKDEVKILNCYLYDQKACFFCKDGYTLVQGQCRLTVFAGSIITIKTQDIAPALQPAQPQLSSAGAQNNNSKSDFPVDGNLHTILAYLNIQCKNFLNGTCIDCYPSYYLDSKNICVQINPLCHTFNFSTRQCSSCYPGYTLTNNYTCIVLPPRIMDPNCRVSNDTICLECYAQYHTLNGKCVADNPICKTVNKNGDCTSCYGGYDLQGLSCVRLSSNTDPFCIRTANDVCLTCANGYYVQSSTGRCVVANLNCLKGDDNGNCISCLPNYMLFKDNCIYPVRKCKEYSDNGKCSTCEVGYYLTHDVCYPRDLTCESYNSADQCISCITTYHLIKGKCIFPALGFDPLCTDYLNSYCIACEVGSYLDNFVCRTVDSKCLSFDFKAARCMECKKGFRAIGAACY